MKIVTSIAYYTREEYELLLKVTDDREVFYDKWEDWLAGYAKKKAELEAEGLVVNRFNVDVAKMTKYLKAHGKKNTTATRAEYVAEMSSLFRK